MPEAPAPFATATAATLNGVAALPHLGIIRARGEDATAFLQGQLTQDVATLPPGQARLAALCNPKGRMRASFHICRLAAGELLLITSADLLAATLKRLSMFVLRAKVKLSDASADFQLRGLIGNAIENIAENPYPMGDEAVFPLPLILPLPPADGAARALWLAAPDAVPPPGPALSEADWLFAEVRAGVARITAPVAEAFVPQMLNYESVGGVHFQKGCYPGQEVVARSQFRGAIKRRTFVGHASGPVQAGQEVFALQGQQPQAVGLIAQAAPAPGGGAAVLAEVLLTAQATAAGGQPLRIGSANGPSLTGLHMPYPLIHDI